MLSSSEPVQATDPVDISDVGVYVIVNIINGKRYFGSSKKSVRGRMKWHKSMLLLGKHVNNHLQSAWNKYGPDAFVFGLVEECSIEKCVEREQAYIDHYKTADGTIGYNLSPTAGSCLGYKQTEATKEKMRKVIKTDAWNAANSAGQMGHVVTEATRAKLRAIRTGMTFSDEVNAKKGRKGNQHALGHKHTEEMKKHLGEVLKVAKAKARQARRLAELDMAAEAEQ